jgi:hypothetical protein
MPGSRFNIEYGDMSSAAGKVGTDIVRLGNITIESQAVEVATYLSPQLRGQYPSQGLLGLGFSSINKVTPVPVKTPLENMIADQDIPADKELFTCYLGSHKDSYDPDRGHSFYTFGEIDETAVPPGEEIAYVPVDPMDGYWTFHSPSTVVNGQALNIPATAAIPDTGTTLMMVHDDVCAAIYSTIPGAYYYATWQAWVFPANVTADQLPVVSFAVGNKQIVIEKEHLVYERVKNGTVFTDMVVGGIQSRGGLDFDIWGATFLRCVYAVGLFCFVCSVC